MPTEASLVATLTSKPDEALLAQASKLASWLEVRADLVGDIDIDWLRDRFDGTLLYTLRSRAEGGGLALDRDERRRRQIAAAAVYDLIDLEAERDLDAERLAAIPADRRLLSWHGNANRLETLRMRFEEMAGHEAAFYKLIPAAHRSGQELLPLALLRSLRRADVIAFASREIGTWTRLLAPRLGAPMVYGALGNGLGAPGQPTLQRLARDYGLPKLPSLDGVFGIVGSPVSHSLSPRLHNGMYRKLGLPAVYLAFEVSSFGEFWIEIVESGSLDFLGFPLRGLSVTAPYKEVGLAVAGAHSPLAEFVGGANTLVLRDRVWEAETTDPFGVVQPLLQRGLELNGMRAAVIGAGGAGRAAAAGLTTVGAQVTLVNRSPQRGQDAARRLRLPFLPRGEFIPSQFELVINATSLGRDGDELPVELEELRAGMTFLDLVYLSDRPTPWVEQLRENGYLAVDGREMLLQQAVRQFQLMTGHEIDFELARSLLELDG